MLRARLSSLSIRSDPLINDAEAPLKQGGYGVVRQADLHLPDTGTMPKAVITLD